MRRKTTLLILLVMMIAVGTGDGQTTDTNAKSVDTPVKIIKKPFAHIGGTNCAESQGLISIRATFDKSAKVTETEIIKSSGCADFDGNAVKAARKITFTPATKNGEPVTIKKLLQYSYRRD